MKTTTLIKFLFGDRQAILDIANCRGAVWLGLLLVLSAGLAREYDGEDLLHEPWHVVLPLGASFLTSLLLFSLVWLVARGSASSSAPFSSSYRSFLGLYWMTAPLAWLYAIPVERFLSAPDATRANLWLLGIVATWRVVLMTRVVSVLWRAGAWAAFFLVMLFADTVAIVVLFLTPIPIVSIMGGIRLTESEIVIQQTVIALRVLGVLSWPVWLIGTGIVALRQGKLWRLTLAARGDARRISRPLWGLGVLSLAVWLPVLLQTQPEQRLRQLVESDLKHGRLREALETMSSHDRSDFPPHWDPPPRVGYGEDAPPLPELLNQLKEIKVQTWVRELFLEKLYGRAGTHHDSYWFWQEMDNDRFEQYLSILEDLPESSEFVAEQRAGLKAQLDDNSPRTPAQKARVRKLLGEAEPTTAPVQQSSREP